MKRRQDPTPQPIRVQNNLTDEEDDAQGDGWRVVRQARIDLASVGESTWGSKQSKRPNI